MLVAADIKKKELELKRTKLNDGSRGAGAGGNSDKDQDNVEEEDEEMVQSSLGELDKAFEAICKLGRETKFETTESTGIGNNDNNTVIPLQGTSYSAWMFTIPAYTWSAVKHQFSFIRVVDDYYVIEREILRD